MATKLGSTLIGQPQPPFEEVAESIIGETIAVVFKSKEAGTTIVFESGNAIRLEPKGAAFFKLKRADVAQTVRQRRLNAEQAALQATRLRSLEHTLWSELQHMEEEKDD